ncbi:Predicted arabinose efflux permease, MFS family [Carboxydocella sporoproducens DSM 16521]|uniref:Predicted arabinose efflux permease, MFS family n=2 Tax=Carboxydocella TaxID=178898 RepID=A0A1T4Q631_9FIRM|nr:MULTISPECIES: MFS transporter [Carboxydocella]AVX21158.1 putative arabinose efflux permease, MFS family [Carboxydocella thermautotrophica]AVX31593.1 putative arabinose efflux permease, MFS family [Carboxydocella thermautotrophica]SJZ98698.1 Predicted arabinose efflux permease, MFS family [Carboxydocella sporoproducens DSM 16521]
MDLRKIIIILGLAGFTVMADNWVVSPILPAIARDIGVSATAAGLLITSYMIPFGLFQLIFGPLADRYGKKQILTFAMFFFTFATALTAMGRGLADLAFYRALTGIFAASVMPISLALIGDLFPLSERQAAIGSFMGISFLGQGISMALGGTIAYWLNWRGVFWVYTVVAAFVTFLFLTTGKKIPSSKNPESQFLTPYLKLLSTGKSLAVYVIVLLEGMFLLGSFSYLGAFIEDNYHYNYLAIGLLMTFFGIAAVIGGRLSGKLAGKYGRKKILLTGLSLAALADLAFILGARQLPLLIAGITMLGLGFMLAHSTLLTMATEFAVQARGAAMSLVAFCFMGGGGIGTAAGGKLLKSVDFMNFYAIYGTALVALVLLALLLVKGQEAVVVGKGEDF